MRVRLLPFTVALLAAVFAFASAAVAAPRSAGPWTGTGLVRAPGGAYLTDSLGRRLQLHGVNLVAKCGGGAVAQPAAGTPCVGPERGSAPAFVLTPDARDPGRRLTAADAATLARLGFNQVRLGLIWEGLEPGPRGVGPNNPRYCAPQPAGRPFPALGAADPFQPAVVAAYLRRVDRTVALLAHAGIRVILDMHQDAFGSAFASRALPTPWNGEGAPRWATCTDGVAPQLPAGWATAYFDAAVGHAIHHFFANDVRGDLQGQFARVWHVVASRFAGNPDVLGYELYNEPLDPSQAGFDSELQCDYGGPGHEPASCRRSGARAVSGGWIGAVRSADPAHVVFYEPAVTTDFGQPESIGIAEPLRFDNLGLAFHVYSDPATTLPLVAGERARTRTLHQPGGPPSIMDEFGASSDTASTGVAVDDAGGSDLSWSYWAGLQLHDPTGNPTEALLDERTRRPHAAKAAALAVPYPAATAGIPGAESWAAATRVLRYRYRVLASVAAPTEIVVPRSVYPSGYRVAASGARVVSAPGTRLLALTARRGARSVSVTVTPR
jgi:endoglycosylceramidase